MSDIYTIPKNFLTEQFILNFKDISKVKIKESFFELETIRKL